MYQYLDAALQFFPKELQRFIPVGAHNIDEVHSALIDHKAETEAISRANPDNLPLISDAIAADHAEFCARTIKESLPEHARNASWQAALYSMGFDGPSWTQIAGE